MHCLCLSFCWTLKRACGHLTSSLSQPGTFCLLQGAIYKTGQLDSDTRHTLDQGWKVFFAPPHPLCETLPYSISLPFYSSSFLFFLAVSTWTALTGEMCITTTCHVTGIDCFLCLSGLQLKRRERLGCLSVVWSSLGDVLVSYTRLAERLPGLARWSSRR